MSALLRQATARGLQLGAARAACTKARVAHSHTLVVPFHFDGITEFKNGIPTEQVRDLVPAEKSWDFWTSSETFRAEAPRFLGLSWVPHGEAWVVSSAFGGDRVLTEGMHFLIPGLHTVKSIKTTAGVAMGVISPVAKTQDGKAVNVYAVMYADITDVVQSATYVDPETRLDDSERAGARFARKVLEQAIREIQAGDANAFGEGLSEQTKQTLAQKLQTAVNAREADFGFQVRAVEIRGAFPAESQVAARLRALDPRPRTEEEIQATHGLSNDYWADLISPPFFYKRKFGSQKEIETPATVSLEWAIPSPPDYHHFNQVPTLIAPTEETEAAAKKAH